MSACLTMMPCIHSRRTPPRGHKIQLSAADAAQKSIASDHSEDTGWLFMVQEE